MNQAEGQLNFALSEPFQKAFPSRKRPSVVRSPAFDRGIIVGGLAQAFDLRGVHSGDLGRPAVMICQSVFRRFLKQALVPVTSTAALEHFLIWLDDKIQNSADGHNNAAHGSNGGVAGSDTSESGTTPEQAGEFENIAHPIKQSLLQLHIANCIGSVANRFVKRSFVFSDLFGAPLIHGELPQLFRFWAFWRRWSSTRGHMAMPVIVWFPASSIAVKHRFHGCSPLQVEGLGLATISLQLVSHERPPFPKGGAT